MNSLSYNFCLFYFIILFYYFFQITEDDDLPTLICSMCLKKLIISNTFRKQCLSSEFHLKKIKRDYDERKLFSQIDDVYDIDPLIANAEIESIEIFNEQFEDFKPKAENAEEQQTFEESLDINTEVSQSEGEDKTEEMNEYEIVTEEVEDEDEERFDLDDSSTQINETIDSGTEHLVIEPISNEDSKISIQITEVVSGVETTKGSRKVNIQQKYGGRRACPICGKLVVNLKPHIDTHSDITERRKPYKCKYCNKEYLQRAQFDAHVNKEHTGEKPFKCDQCDKTFHGRPSLRMHKIQHSNERRFVCEYCDKSYLYAHHLSHHRLMHTATRQYACSDCDYRSVHFENLKRHILSKHTSNELKPYKCELCKRAFNGRSNLVRHQKTMHRQ